MPRIGRRIGFSVAIILLAGFLAPLFADAPLTPASAAWLDVEEETLAPRDNLYIWVSGFDGPLGEEYPEDPPLWGVQVYISQVIADEDAAQMQVYHYAPPPTKAPTLTFSTPEPRLCSFERPKCLETVRADHDTVQASIEDNRDLLRRYRRFWTVPGLRTLTPDHYEAIIPNLAMVADTHRLFLASIVLEDDEQTRIAELVEDLAFVRRTLAAADALELKMVFARMLSRDLHLYAALIEESPTLRARPLPQVREPLSNDEKNLEPALKRYFRIMARTFFDIDKRADDVRAGVPVLGSIAYKPKRTINHWQRYLAFEAQYAGMTENERLAAGVTPPERPVYERVINSAGSVLMDEGFLDVSPYAFRLRDLDGLIRLVELKRRILAENLADDQIQRWLITQADELGDPYTGAPMRWDADASRLYFDSPGPIPSLREVFFRRPAQDVSVRVLPSQLADSYARLLRAERRRPLDRHQRCRQVQRMRGLSRLGQAGVVGGLEKNGTGASNWFFWLTR